jgi:hypothetical protein
MPVYILPQCEGKENCAMTITRRKAAGLLTGVVPAAAIEPMRPTQSAAPGQPLTLNWLGDAPPSIVSGVSWGVPWPRGAVRKDQAFHLVAADGRVLPLQSWPLAYWPDGTLKWSGFATLAGPDAGGPLRLRLGRSDRAGGPALRVSESAQAITVDTGRLECRIPRQGAFLTEAMKMEGRVVARQARLVCSLEDRSQWEPNHTIRIEDFVSRTHKVTPEQSGPVRAVVKIEGVHQAENGTREWLPFVVRLYFYAGVEPVRMIHSIIFDGDEQRDFIRGLGIACTVPMREQVHNRHVRFWGEGAGLWAEPVEPLTGSGRLATPGGGGSVYASQLAGQRIANREAFNTAGQKLIADWAVWDAFKLVQSTADGFTIRKRTNPQSCWLDAGAGRRASGLVFAGDVSGGLAVGVRNFWQSCPASLEVSNAAGEAAELRVWLWTPEAPAMDLRHYDTRAHSLDSSYEDVQPGFSTPHGIARTSELMLYPSASVPEKPEVVKQAQAANHPPLLVCSPQYLHSLRTFGIWSLPDRSTPARRTIEERLEGAIALYQKEIEQRHWYGFWDYGDVMHSYDPGRHTWRYDIGGYAWDNTELATDMWLWYSFLRTGRADIFRMAEAMTRHTSEVDCYHLGRFAMLGSRHNVRHWGCGAKEVRISQAAYRRFYYYLTTDERTGDLMHEVADADYKATEIDAMRLAVPTSRMPSKYPGRLRGGPDWLACVGNWMTEWERTLNGKYRDKIVAGMDCISRMPFGFLSGPYNLFGYDPATGNLYTLAEDPFGTYNLTTIMGGAEVIFELNELIDHPGWRKAWLQYCRLAGAPKAVVSRDMTTGQEGSDAAYAGGGRLAAYVYLRTRNPAFARRALGRLAGGATRYSTRRVEGPEVLNSVDEAPMISTNSVAQSSLEAIEVLEMCGDQLPEAGL